MTEMIGKKLTHGQFGNKVAKILKDKGCWLLNVHGHRMQKRFVPDLLAIGLRWRGFLEFKIDNDKCSDGQKEQIERLQKRNFACYVLRYNRELNCIQIENRESEILNLVAWGALWDWLKKPIVVSSSPFVKAGDKVFVGGQTFDPDLTGGQRSSTDGAKLNLYDKRF